MKGRPKEWLWWWWCESEEREEEGDLKFRWQARLNPPRSVETHLGTTNKGQPRGAVWPMRKLRHCKGDVEDQNWPYPERTETVMSRSRGYPGLRYTVIIHREDVPQGLQALKFCAPCLVPDKDWLCRRLPVSCTWWVLFSFVFSVWWVWLDEIRMTHGWMRGFSPWRRTKLRLWWFGRLTWLVANTFETQRWSKWGWC